MSRTRGVETDTAIAKLFLENQGLTGEVKRLSRELRTREKYITAINAYIAEMLKDEPLPGTLSERLVEYIKKELGVERVSLLMPETTVPGQQILVIKAACGLDKDIFLDTRQDIEYGFAGKVMKSRNLLEIKVGEESGNKSAYHSDSLIVPIPYHEKPMGVIAVTNKKRGKDFDFYNKVWLNYVAMLSAWALSQTIATEKNLQSYSRAVDAKDHYTYGHSNRVTLYSLILADELNLAGRYITALALAQLHDTGKIGIQEVILNKPGKLTDKEWKIMRTHPTVGYAILPHPVARELALHHHERWDGKGYPDGLAGDEIPESCRVLSIADTFDAMTSNRPYRKGMPIEKALGIIGEESGKQFWLDAVQAFVELCNNGQRAKIEKIMAQGRNAEYALREERVGQEPVPNSRLVKSR